MLHLDPICYLALHLLGSAVCGGCGVVRERGMQREGVPVYVWFQQGNAVGTAGSVVASSQRTSSSKASTTEGCHLL